jgi:hypothetical protein
MKYSQIKEGVEYGDLKSLITTNISVAEFEPKTGTDDDVVVLGFYADDEAPANDLASFIEKSSVSVLDTEVSPAADEDGYYMVFVELDNEDLMKKVFALIEDVSRLVEVETWNLKFFNGTEKEITTDKISEWLKKT